MVVFKYGDAGDRIPVLPREIWRVGPHYFACGDLEAEDFMCFRKFLVRKHLARPTMMYCDPPWNQALAGGFRTKAGVDRRVDFKAFLSHLGPPARWVQGPVFVEMSIHTESLLREVMAEEACLLRESWGITYFRTRPARLLLFNTGGSPRRFSGASPEGMDDAHSPGWAMEQCPTCQVILDPCVGVGWTAVAAAKLGRVCYGLDLHPRRLAVTLDKLGKLMGLPVTKVGEL